MSSAPQRPGNHELTLADVPVDGFWSVSVYNADGFFEPNPRNSYSVNNAIPTPENWNILVRMYRPRPEVEDGTWQLPELTPVIGLT